MPSFRLSVGQSCDFTNDAIQRYNKLILNSKFILYLYRKIKMSAEVQENRKRFLEILRSGKYVKAPILSDDKGRPVIEDEEYLKPFYACACGVLTNEFGQQNGKASFSEAKKAVGLKTRDCQYIQDVLNDNTDLSFSQIAAIIETEIFK